MSVLPSPSPSSNVTAATGRLFISSCPFPAPYPARSWVRLKEPPLSFYPTGSNGKNNGDHEINYFPLFFSTYSQDCIQGKHKVDIDRMYG